MSGVPPRPARPAGAGAPVDDQHASRCNFCRSGRLARSRRKRWEHLLSWAGLFPYRCDECDKRSYRFAGDQAMPTPVVPTDGDSIGRLVDILHRMVTADAREPKR